MCLLTIGSSQLLKHVDQLTYMSSVATKLAMLGSSRELVAPSSNVLYLAL